MIDLHMHTNYSDGTDSVIELLKNVEEANLDIISITDHNTALAYEELEKINIKEFYSGKIIPGVELNTKVLGIPIEILGYKIDYKKINELLPQTYIDVKKRNRIEVERLFNKCVEAGLKIDNNCLNNYNEDVFASKFIQTELIKYEENKQIISEDAWNDTRIFYRKYMSNPEGILYVEMDDFVPDFQTAANIIRACGGKVFLPHIYEYRENSEKVLNYILQHYQIDGIECFYTTFTEEQTSNLLKICKDNNLYISGGSDYHGRVKPNVKVGVGFGNLLINEEIIQPWA